VFELKAHLRALVEAHAPSGHEGPLRELLREAWGPLSDALETDGLGSLIATKGASRAQEPALRIMLAAHMDEIGLMVREVVARHRATKAAVVVSRYGDGPSAPPVLFDRRLFGELAAMESGGGRAIIERHREDVAEVVWPSEAAQDVDCPDDYASVRAALAG